MWNGTLAQYDLVSIGIKTHEFLASVAAPDEDGVHHAACLRQACLLAPGLNGHPLRLQRAHALCDATSQGLADTGPKFPGSAACITSSGLSVGGAFDCESE